MFVRIQMRLQFSIEKTKAKDTWNPLLSL